MLDIDASDCLLGVVPLAHSFGFNGLLVLALLTGASLRLVPDRDRDALPGVVRDSGATIVAGPPALLHDLAAAVRDGERLGPQVRLFMTGATEVRPDALLPMAAEAGIPRVSSGYGLTQTCGTVAICPDIGRLTDEGHAPMTVVPGVEVAVVDALGAAVPTGTRGRVLTLGYQVAVPTDADGWLVTGDEGHLHPDGTLCITGRVDDQLVVSGFNVDPVRVELALARSPYVAQVAVVGLPDPRRGHRLVAVAVPVDPADADGRNDAAVLAQARAVLARYEVPDTVVWTDDLPHTTTGKLSRATVRGMLAERLGDHDQED
jgi:acyl-CoA synthetase (AMP-forming)/AMP-acid ligase II